MVGKRAFQTKKRADIKALGNSLGISRDKKEASLA